MVAPPTGAPRRRRIPEIEGVRGLALTLVVLFHVVGNGRVSGGVDVFLFVSGYLLTASLMRRASEPEGIVLRVQYRNVFLKLVPPALIVLIATALLTLMITPRSLWDQNLREIVASALFLENWELIGSQLVYGAAGPETSPLQHFWSLSIQGQFFVAWPVVVAAAVGLARRAGQPAGRVVLFVLLSTTAASAIWATILVGLEQPVAYFSSWTRFWQLGVGGILALIQHRLLPPARLRGALGWTGLALIVSCGFVLDGGALFPGPWALWPVVGAVLVIVSSGAPDGTGPLRLLELRPLVFLAAVSYPLYLWHWPVLIFYLEYRAQPAVGVRGALGVLVLSVALAGLTDRWVSRPLHRHRSRLFPVRSLMVLAVATTVVAGSAAVYVNTLQWERRAALDRLEASQADFPGARALRDDDVNVPLEVGFQPSPADAGEDFEVELYERNCIQPWEDLPGTDTVLECRLENAPRSGKTIVMVGASHVTHWYSAVKPVAEAEGWQLITMFRNDCRFAQWGDGPVSERAMCVSWNDNVLDRIMDIQPDAVITEGTRTNPDPEVDEHVSEEQVAAWGALDAVDVPVLPVRGTPRFFEPVPACIERHDGATEPCGQARLDVMSPVNPLEEVRNLPANVLPIDLTDAFCGLERCEVVEGNVLIYRDTDHLSSSYARSLQLHIRDALHEALPGLFK
ncbi:acyltransferase family protein [Aeromicrobium piscarium]|uniref:Acyltransferase n=1 Tax=Aeromicrobium piscarium TaxID=2590901 RepID=A0A554S7L8_9ACTN|nr:acyltransferase family protein [Aeromicrobium piscarium]TSD62348.1 acyltransferase [Aeromicrobium piscarium]